MGGSPFRELQEAYNDFIQQRLTRLSQTSDDLMTLIHFSHLILVDLHKFNLSRKWFLASNIS
jgi:hypothetical protein